ncbi:MAG: hypothetical protein IKT65_03035 [Clostridia bacterium]|nr:hypothetical protein [Clostridia bacterium]
MRYCDIRDLILQDVREIKHSMSDEDFRNYINENDTFSKQPSLKEFILRLSDKELNDSCDLAAERLEKAFNESMENEERILSLVATDDHCLFPNCKAYIIPNGENACTFAHSTLGCVNRLVFKNASLEHCIDCNYIYKELYESENGYTYCFVDEDYTEHTFTFECLQMQTEYYNATPRAGYSMWNDLISGAKTVCKKCDSGKASEKENAAYPVLLPFSKLIDEYEIGPIPENEAIQMREFLSKHASKRSQRLFERSSKMPVNAKRSKLLYELFTSLNKDADVFYALYDIISDCQGTLPYDTDAYATDDMADQRQKITSEILSLGYTGQYPIFTKRTELKGLHLVSDGSLGQSYFILNEKNVFSFIYVREELDCGKVVHFLESGSVLARKKDIEKGVFPDAFTPFFTKNGRHFSMANHFINEDTDLKTKVQIAAKRAELLPLSKSERKAVFTTPVGCVILSALLSGVLFGGMFTVVGSVVLALTDSPMSACIPVFAFTSLSFALCMGIIMMICNRR